MSQITTQEIRRSHTSPTRVNTPTGSDTPIPVDTSINPFSPSSLRIATELHAQKMAEDVPPTFYAGSSQMPSKDKGKGKATSPSTPPRQPIFPEQPGGDDPDDSGDDNSNDNPPNTPNPPGPP